MPAPLDREDFPDDASYQAAMAAFFAQAYKPPQTPEEWIRAYDCLLDAAVACIEHPEPFTKDEILAMARSLDDKTPDAELEAAFGRIEYLRWSKGGLVHRKRGRRRLGI